MKHIILLLSILCSVASFAANHKEYAAKGDTIIKVFEKGQVWLGVCLAKEVGHQPHDNS